MRYSFYLPLIAVTSILSATFPISAQDSSDTPKRLRQLIDATRPSVATIRVRGRDGDELAIGTGFVIDPDGLVATNLHVISEGRPFTVELPGGRQLPVIAVEASDRAGDLAIIRVDTQSKPLVALPLSDAPLSQGTQVVAFGNPLGLRDSVVSGIVSAIREIDGREMIQLAMPTQPGNSGGPLVNMQGQVCGIINMKSAVDDNLGFAIPIAQLTPVREQPNPVTYDRWVTLGGIDTNAWTPIFDASWQQRGGIISASGLGSGFGGRSLCLSRVPTPELPFEVAVEVRLDDESGAAGLAFHGNGQDRHYGFYPSNGRMRLTCFKGPSVYSWEVLADVATEHYLPGQWNRLRVRVERGRLRCYVNGTLVVESNDRQLTSGQVGLAKFRGTQPDFKRFAVGAELTSDLLTDDTNQLLQQVLDNPQPFEQITTDVMRQLSQASDAVARELQRRAIELENDAKKIRRLAVDVTLAPVLEALERVVDDESTADDRLLRGALTIAKLDNPDIDVNTYLNRVDEMAKEIKQRLAVDASPKSRRETLHRYLFDENGFHGGRAEYYHPANSHLDRVIDDREGLPITLSVLYMEIGRKIGMKVEGVGLPGHFVVRQVLEEESHQLIDVFERGTLMSDDEARKLVSDYTGRSINENDLREQTVVEILARVVNNLLGVASRDSDLDAIHRYCEALVAIRPDSAEFRIMRSQARAMTQRKTAAIEDLDWLIERAPAGFNPVQALRLRDSLIETDNDN